MTSVMTNLDLLEGMVLLYQDLTGQANDLIDTWNGHDAEPLVQAAKLVDQAADVLEQAWPDPDSHARREALIDTSRCWAEFRREQARVVGTGHPPCFTCDRDRLAKMRELERLWLQSREVLRTVAATY